MLLCQSCYVVMSLVWTRLNTVGFFFGGGGGGEIYQQQLDLPVTSRVHQKFSDNMGCGPLRQLCVDFIFMKIV